MLQCVIIGFQLASSLAFAAPEGARAASIAEIQESAYRKLLRATLADPEVQDAIRAAKSGDGGVELTTTQLRSWRSQPEAMLSTFVSDEDDGNTRDGFGIGVDFSIALPDGLGVTLAVTPIAPFTISAGVASTAVTYTLEAEVTVNILPIFMKAKWTPIVSVGFHQLRFTSLVNKLAEDYVADFEELGFNVDLTEIVFNELAVLAGIDYVGKKGFHFQVYAGKLFQLGEFEYELHDSGATFAISNAESWTGGIKFGHVF